jgi:amino acid transporter
MLVASVVLVCVAVCVAQFARRMASAGSLYTFASHGLGPFGGWLTGWTMAIAYTFGAIVSVFGVSLNLGGWLSLFGLPTLTNGSQIVLALLVAILATLFSFTGIRLSTRLSLGLELLSILAILTVLFATFANKGVGDTQQLSLSHVTMSGVLFGVLLSVLWATGFESGATLGPEAKNPYQAIPRSILAVAIAAGVFFTIAAYGEIRGFNALGTNIGSSASPLNDIANGVGLRGFDYVIDLGIAMSFFAAVVACLNAGSRTVFAMSRDGMLSTRLGVIHARTRTPHMALVVLSALAIIVPLGLLVATGNAVNSLGYVATVGTFAYSVGYVLISAATPFYLRRRGDLGAGTLVAAIVGVVGLIAVLGSSIYPVPAYPFNLIGYLYFTALALGALWYPIAVRRSPDVAKRIGRNPDEVENVAPEPAPALR